MNAELSIGAGLLGKIYHGRELGYFGISPFEGVGSAQTLVAAVTAGGLVHVHKGVKL